MRSEKGDLRPMLKRARGGDAFAVKEILSLADDCLDGRVIVTVGWPEESVRDLKQDALIKITANLRSFKGDNERQFCAWVRTIFDNEYRNFIRARETQKRQGTRRASSPSRSTAPSFAS